MNVVLIIGILGSPTSGDLAVRDRLATTLGHTVTLYDDQDPTPDLSTTDLVVISPTCIDNFVGSKFDNAPCGVFAMSIKPHSAFSSGSFLGGGGTQFDFTVAAPGDSLVGAITGTVDLLASAPTDAYSYIEPEELAPGAITVLVRGGTRVGLARIQQGGLLTDGSIASTRRVFYGANDDWPTLFNADGWAVFDNAVAYASVAPGDFPDADAGFDQAVDVNTLVQLAGGGTDIDGTVVSYKWRVISHTGPAITLSSTSVANPTFTAPGVACTIVLGLQVTDNDDILSAEDTIRISVVSHMLKQVALGGSWVEKPVYIAKAGSWY